MATLATLLASATLAQAQPVQLTVLVFDTPLVSVLVAAFDTPDDCIEVAWTLQRYTTAPARYTCKQEEF